MLIFACINLVKERLLVLVMPPETFSCIVAGIFLYARWERGGSSNRCVEIKMAATALWRARAQMEEEGYYVTEALPNDA